MGNFPFIHKLTVTGVALAVSAGFTPRVSAFERVTLQNGFEVKCDHHREVEGHTRLFLSRSEDNYIEFTPAEIATVELLPDPVEDRPSKDPAKTVSTQQGTSDAVLFPSDLHEMLTVASTEHHLDVDLLESVVKAESGGNARVVSKAGARGLMQLMPDTSMDLGVVDSFKPEQNVRGGSTYLDGLLTRYHENLALALAAYNAGPAAVDKYHGIPPYHETRAYVAWVIHEFNRRVLAREAEARRKSSPVREIKASK